MQTTDLETAAESLLIDDSPAIIEEPEEERLDEDTDTDDEMEADEAAEAEADDEEAEDADEAEDDAEDADDEDEDTEEDEADEQPDAETYTVKVDGEEKQVTLEELKRSYSGQDYIQKGMQEAADMRKQSREIFDALQAEQQNFVQAVQSIKESGIKAPPQAPSAEMLEVDPIGYMQAKAQYDAEMNEYNAQQAQIQDVQRRHQAMQQQAMQAHLEQEARKLEQKYPEFADPEKGRAIKEKLLNFGVEAYGFTAEEIGQVTDSRNIDVLMDAMKWRELQKGKAEAKKKPTPPKVVKPTGRRKTTANDARKKLKAQALKTGRLEDFAGLLLEPKSG